MKYYYGDQVINTMIERIQDLARCGVPPREISIHLGLLPGTVEVIIEWSQS